VDPLVRKVSAPLQVTQGKRGIKAPSDSTGGCSALYKSHNIAAHSIVQPVRNQVGRIAGPAGILLAFSTYTIMKRKLVLPSRDKIATVFL